MQKILSSGSRPLIQSSLQSNYQKTVLPNGIRIVTEEIPYVRSVSCGVWINVGSRHENEGNNGISHFLEHMVFKGTKRYSTRQIARSLESVGGYLNAFTTKEHTCYYARILDNHLPQAIDVISDLIQAPLLLPKEMAKEKLVILEELKNIEDDPDDLIHDYLDLRIYNKHPLGWPIIGKSENIRKFSRAELLEFMHRYYSPNRMVVAAAGNLKHRQLVDLIESKFRRNSSTRVVRKNEHGPKQSKFGTEVFEKPINQAHLCMGTLGYSIKSHSRYSLLLLNSVLGEGMSSRLFQNIREKYGFAYSIYSFANMLSDAGSFGIYVGTDNSNIDHSIDLIVRELEKLKTSSVSRSEINRTKAQLKGTMIFGLESMSNRMMRLGSGELYFREYLPLDQVLRSVEAVEPEDLTEIAKKLFRMDKFSTIVFRAGNDERSASLKSS
jgi:predicted Zn-dependent peptidase